MNSRTFSQDMQIAFARLSGDFNPMHVDAVAARRLVFGRPVVHGVHTLLWALDEAAGEGRLSGGLKSLRAAFRQPLLVGQTATVRLAPDGATSGVVQVDERLILEFQFTPAEVTAAARPEIPDRAPPSTACAALTFEQAVAAAGDVELVFSREAARGFFPRLVQTLPAEQLAVLLAATRIVGMCCPGEHSLFAEIQVDFHHASETTARLTYSVAHADPRFSRMVLRIEGAGATGKLTTFYRPPPVRQAAVVDLLGRVRPGEFAGARVLVVGGSRGIGEAAAKLLATGSAEVCLTYQQGRSDAERVDAEIRAAGFHSTMLELDVERPAEELAARLSERGPFTHMIYCATPRIEQQRTTIFSAERFGRLCAVYVVGFLHVVQAIHREDQPLGVLYPSTVFLDELAPDFPEYVAAKAAGEALCAVLEKRLAGLRILRPRLPRIRTDQTAALMASAVAEAADVLLPCLRKLVGGGRPIG